MKEFNPIQKLSLQVLTLDTPHNINEDYVIAYRFDNNEVILIENELYNSIESLVTLIENNGSLVELLFKDRDKEFTVLNFKDDSLVYLCSRDFIYDVLANSASAETANEIVNRYGIEANIKSEKLKNGAISNTIWIKENPWALMQT